MKNKKLRALFGNKTPLPARPLNIVRQEYVDTCAELGDTMYGLRSLGRKHEELESKQDHLRHELVAAQKIETAERAKASSVAQKEPKLPIPDSKKFEVVQSESENIHLPPAEVPNATV